MQPITLEVSGVSKAYDQNLVLQDAGFRIHRGEVRCLAGENGSGKSTLIKIIAGTLAQDQGDVRIHGQLANTLSPSERIRHGLSIIYQDFALLPNLTVAENITFLSQISRQQRWRSVSQQRHAASVTLERIGIQLPLDTRVEDLPVASKQLTAIARAVHNESSILILDEPTTALTRKEVDHLLLLIDALRRQHEVSFLFVSHKLDEVFGICDSVTVLRDKRVVASGSIDEFTPARLSYEITGRTLDSSLMQPPRPANIAPRLAISNLSRQGEYQDISFSLKPGEVLGIAGLLGSGRTELAQTLAGLNAPDSGQALYEGEPLAFDGIAAFHRKGITYLPEDRLSEGLFLEQSIHDNIVISGLDHGLTPSIPPRLDHDKLADISASWVTQLAIKTANRFNPVRTLSGGNQQRVVMARYLALSPKVFILNCPTVGVDVGSKAGIHKLIADMAASGAAILIISDDLPELMTVCHRILVMVDGRFAADYDQSEFNLDYLSAAITGAALEPIA